jgi:hypothetical protein
MMLRHIFTPKISNKPFFIEKIAKTLVHRKMLGHQPPPHFLKNGSFMALLTLNQAHSLPRRYI